MEIGAALEIYRSDPAVARILNQPFQRRMQAFAALLALWGSRINLTAHPDDPTEVAFHIVDSLMPLCIVPQAFGAGKRVLDFGSGAGFPGLILASGCAAHFTLAEARRKKTSFLRIAVAELQLDNVDILATRLDAAALQPEFDVAVSRASGPATGFHAVAGAALRPAGLALLYSTPSQRLELAAARMCGLVNYRRRPYSLRRGHESVNRVLALWDACGKPA